MRAWRRKWGSGAGSEGLAPEVRVWHQHWGRKGKARSRGAQDDYRRLSGPVVKREELSDLVSGALAELGVEAAMLLSTEPVPGLGLLDSCHVDTFRKDSRKSVLRSGIQARGLHTSHVW